MNDPLLDVALRLGMALLVGGLIGTERESQERPAGFRTHALVCLSSAMLMVFSVTEWRWLPGSLSDTVEIDPIRMAQGIVAGIGFLGAGVIFREGRSVQGLTTAASVWATACIGILIGVGQFGAALVAAALTLFTLLVLRRIERRLPFPIQSQHTLRFSAERVMAEHDLRAMLERHGFKIRRIGYGLVDGGRFFEYRLVISTSDPDAIGTYAQYLQQAGDALEFALVPHE